MHRHPTLALPLFSLLSQYLQPWALFVLLSAGLLGHAEAAAGLASKQAHIGKSAVPRCSWDSPGVNAYGGELAAAVDHYGDIPAATRAALKARMAAQRYDDIAVIGRSHITGQWHYGAELRDMHFGNGKVCRTVTRDRWAAQAEERGLVYCEGAHCLIVPTVCRNVSRVVRRQAVAGGAQDKGGAGTSSTAGAGGSGGAGSSGGAAEAPALALLPESTELQYEAPSAGGALASGSEALTWTGPTALTLLGTGPDAHQQASLLSAQQPEALSGTGTVAAGGGTAAPGPLAALSYVPLLAQPLDPYVRSTGGSPWPGAPTGTLAPTAPVPEPTTAVLMALGLAAVARWALRPKRL